VWRFCRCRPWQRYDPYDAKKTYSLTNPLLPLKKIFYVTVTALNSDIPFRLSKLRRSFFFLKNFLQPRWENYSHTLCTYYLFTFSLIDVLFSGFSLTIFQRCVAWSRWRCKKGRVFAGFSPAGAKTGSGFRRNDIADFECRRIFRYLFAFRYFLYSLLLSVAITLNCVKT
jgi:hypothetical protein